MYTKNIFRSDICEIHWIDIECDNVSWLDAKDLDDLIACDTKCYRNIAYYYGENKDYYFFYTGISPENTYFDYVRIPKGCVKMITKIKMPNIAI